MKREKRGRRTNLRDMNHEMEWKTNLAGHKRRRNRDLQSSKRKTNKYQRRGFLRRNRSWSRTRNQNQNRVAETTRTTGTNTRGQISDSIWRVLEFSRPEQPPELSPAKMKQRRNVCVPIMEEEQVIEMCLLEL